MREFTIGNFVKFFRKAKIVCELTAQLLTTVATIKKVALANFKKEISQNFTKFHKICDILDFWL